MIRANTWRVVAMMADLHPIQDGTIMHDPRSAMRANILAIEPNDSITSWESLSNPKPAFVCLLYKFPKSLLDGYWLIRIVLKCAASSAAIYAGSVSPREKLNATI